MKVNGITNDMVEDASSFDEILPSFLGFIGDSVLVRYNIHSILRDGAFLNFCTKNLLTWSIILLF